MQQVGNICTLCIGADSSKYSISVRIVEGTVVPLASNCMRKSPAAPGPLAWCMSHDQPHQYGSFFRAMSPHGLCSWMLNMIAADGSLLGRKLRVGRGRAPWTALSGHRLAANILVRHKTIEESRWAVLQVQKADTSIRMQKQFAPLDLCVRFG